MSAVSKTSDPTFQNQIGHILSHMEEAPEDDSVAELLSAQEDLGVDTMEYDDKFEIQEVLSSGVRPHPCSGSLLSPTLLSMCPRATIFPSIIPNTQASVSAAVRRLAQGD